jgi:hypothetical protein
MAPLFASEDHATAARYSPSMPARGVTVRLVPPTRGCGGQQGYKFWRGAGTLAPAQWLKRRHVWYRVSDTVDGCRHGRRDMGSRQRQPALRRPQTAVLDESWTVIGVRRGTHSLTTTFHRRAVTGLPCGTTRSGCSRRGGDCCRPRDSERSSERVLGARRRRVARRSLATSSGGAGSARQVSSPCG